MTMMQECLFVSNIFFHKRHFISLKTKKYSKTKLKIIQKIFFNNFLYLKNFNTSNIACLVKLKTIPMLVILKTKDF